MRVINLIEKLSKQNLNGRLSTLVYVELPDGTRYLADAVCFKSLESNSKIKKCIITVKSPPVYTKD